MQHDTVDAVTQLIRHQRIELQAAQDGLHLHMVGLDIGLFMQMANKGEPANAAAVPFSTLVPAFITSELKSAFTIGFLIYIPFVVIDLIVASVLMSMGMMMLSPMMISMPFKLMLFVLVDGWSLIMGSLAASFAMP